MGISGFVNALLWAHRDAEEEESYHKSQTGMHTFADYTVESGTCTRLGCFCQLSEKN